MKKITAAVLCLVFVLSLVGCGKVPVPGSGEGSKPITEYVLTGNVLTIADGAMTVEVKENLPYPYPIEGMKSTSLNVPITNMPSSPEPVVGDTVEITYNGRITTSTPEGGIEIYSISSADIKQIEVKRNTTAESTGAGAPPAIEFPTAEELVQNIKEVKASGTKDVAYPWGPQLYGKDCIFLLKEAPLPEFEQEAVMLVLQGTAAYYRRESDTAVFCWSQGYEKTAELTERYGLEPLGDTGFFVGSFGSETHIFRWENGDQFEFTYPTDTGVSPEEVAERLTVVRYDC